MASNYHIHDPSQMEPLLPGQTKIGPLRERAAEIFRESHRMREGLPHHLKAALREPLRMMNAYYSNKIEGQHTEPLLIEQAMAEDYSSKPEVASKQRQALAHIKTERHGESRLNEWFGTRLFSHETVRLIHEHLYGQLGEQDRIQVGPTGKKVIVQPGMWRDSEVKVRHHIPPDPATVPALLSRWEEVYSREKAGESALIAIAFAHHRLAWIHPFVDGNGRTARLHTHLALSHLGLTAGLWSPMRELARRHEEYYAYLGEADAERQGATDGRGVLSERGLIKWGGFFLDVCADQISFMSDRLQMSSVRERLKMFLAAQAQLEAFKSLKMAAEQPILHAMTVGPISRALFKAMTLQAPRTAERTLKVVLDLGILKSDTPRGELYFVMPGRVLSGLFPNLWPELDADVAASINKVQLGR